MDSPIVSVLQGQLRGCTGTDINGNKFYKFLGIPYAKPPVGDLRFRDPVPGESWVGIRDATVEGEISYSRCEITRNVIGSENCLFMNVFTKSLPDRKEKLKPVMVWIYGGGFAMGSSRTVVYGPELLITEDIVLVTFNYRLGMLGFLKLDDSSLRIPGNAGLKDQNLALRWVKNNIEFFNGDPNNVTIFGESAGAASVHYHILSPMSRDLFHKAILQSGCALNGWALCDHDVKTILKKSGIDVNNEKEALELLKDMPVEKLFAIQESLDMTRKGDEIREFGPVIEASSKKQGFITKHPIEIITSGEFNKVPMIFGYTNKEGIIFDFIRQLMPHMKTNNVNIEESIPWYLEIEKGSEQSKAIAKKLENLYFQGPDTNDNQRMLFTDTAFLSGIMASVKNHLPTSVYPIYLYRMSVESSLNIYKTRIGAQNVPGVCHFDDVGYLFKTVWSPEKIDPGSLEEISIKRFVKLWTNFATYGNPTPEHNGLEIVWKPVMGRQINFLDIGNELALGVNPESERMALWREIFHQSPHTIKYL